MSGDQGARRLLPQQNPPMQSFTFAPSNFGQKDNQKNYVFVDEHNRHKRLKVMRACEGCRRRKIKCDAATTNTWPCSACVRLKLHCIPPTVNYDGDYPGANQAFDPDGRDYNGTGGQDDYDQQLPLQGHFIAPPDDIHPPYVTQAQYNDPVALYHQNSYAGQHLGTEQSLQYSALPVTGGVLDGAFQSHQAYAAAPLQPPLAEQSDSPETYQQDQFSERELADLLGDLKMDATGTAPYLNSAKRNVLFEEPAVEDHDDFEDVLPPVVMTRGLKIRIPPELMPDDETVQLYFDTYFKNVHPYVPVLNKTAFLHQWNTDRESISPLILEAVFAISGRLAEEPAQGQQWLALAGKHADAFMDVPRLSTLQALLIILKARESAPKRGYYYRSWMTVVQCVTMAKDLGLDEHYDDHQAGRSCGSTLTDCITKQRIWHTLFIVELMIGTSQGRVDNNVVVDSLDLNVPRPVPGDESEFHVTRQFIYFTKVVCNVRKMNQVYAKIKNNKNWGVDSGLVNLNPLFESWLDELPEDLQISFAPDGSPPWLSTHFIGNLHSYYYLSIIMLHRPQLTFMDPNASDGGWKHNMMLCYSSAKHLCRIQEAILENFGLIGLLSMQRGINYTIYCILTCTVLHLVCITSPDPDLNTDARDYFTRHMRILEKCAVSWPMPDMQAQIESLRVAFSADLRKPFMLKPSFPYGSPGVLSSASPPRSDLYRDSSVNRSSSIDSQSYEIGNAHGQPQVAYPGHPITPPVSAGAIDAKEDSHSVQQMAMMPAVSRGQQNMMPIVDNTWNPTRIFEQWNSTFNRPIVDVANSPPTKMLTPATQGMPQLQMTTSSSSSSNMPVNTHQQLSHQQQQSYQPQQQQQQQQQAYSTTAPVASFVTPSMWQQSVASVYEVGIKRQWDYGDHSGLADGTGNTAKRMR